MAAFIIKEDFIMAEYNRKASRVIDNHTHVWDWFEDGKPFYERFDEYRKCNQLDYVNVTCVPYINHPILKRDVSQNIMGAILKLKDPHFFAHGGLFYLNKPVQKPIQDTFRPEVQLQELMDIGFDGMKMLETKPTTYKMLKLPPNDPVYDAYYTILEANHIPVIWHVNDPDFFWNCKEKMSPSHIQSGWWYGDGSFTSNTQVYEEIYDVLRRFPKLCITFAHMLFLTPHPDQILHLLRTYPNVTFDLTPNPYLYQDITKDYDLWRQIFIDYPDRFLLGTDRGSRHKPASTIPYVSDLIRFIESSDHYNGFGHPEEIHGLNLDPDTADSILYRNFLRIAGDTPRPIQIDALMDYIDKYLPFIAEGDTKEQIKHFRHIGRI